MNDILKRLEEITDNLPEPLTLDRIAIFDRTPKVVEYDVDHGVCIGFGLYKTQDVAIQRAFLTKGTVFVNHIHDDSIEHLIVIDGKVEVFRGTESVLVGTGEHCSFQPQEDHYLKALEPTWLIGVTIPADIGYPDA